MRAIYLWKTTAHARLVNFSINLAHASSSRNVMIPFTGATTQIIEPANALNAAHMLFFGFK